jgi:hypothetical protein
MSELPKSCGPAATLDDLMLVTLFQECATRYALFATEVLHERLWECQRELIARLNTRSPVEGAVAWTFAERESLKTVERALELNITLDNSMEYEAVRMVCKLLRRCRPPVAVPVVDEDMRDAARYRWWRENFGFIEEDGDGIVGCAFSCQIQLPILQSASHAELFDMVADYHLAAAALSTATKVES